MAATATRTVTSADGALARSLAYRLLSQAFAYPMPPEVARLRDEDLPLALASAEGLEAPVRAGLEALAEALEDATSEELEADYRSVFSHVHSADCPMYETDYGARDIWRQSETLADVAGFYRAFGVREDGERPDHVSAELEFLHLLAYKSVWADSGGDETHAETCREAEAAFLRDHVLRWVPGFATRAATLAGTETYAAAGRLLRALLDAEAARLGLEIPEDAPPPPPATEDDPPSLCEVES